MRSLFNKGCSGAACILFLSGAAGLCLAQQTSDQTSYLELSWMRVKQDKVAEFGQLASRIADANRRGKGDQWIAYMDYYGRDNYIWIVSRRNSLTELEPAMNSFMGAVKEFMGYSPERFMAETSKTVEASGGELLRQRFDLSWGIKDADDWTAHLAKAHYVAVITVHVKAGHMADVENQLRTLKDAVVGHEDAPPGSVMQLLFGGDPGTFYVRIPLESITDMNKMVSPRGALGEEGYKRYSEMTAQNIVSFDYALKRFVPEWSNPPAAFIEANPTMWKVKPIAPAKPKAAASEKKPATTGQ